MSAFAPLLEDKRTSNAPNPSFRIYVGVDAPPTASMCQSEVFEHHWQRTQLINAVLGHLTEYGWIAPKGPSHVADDLPLNCHPAAVRVSSQLP
jgi:hypothetical protein